MEYSKLLISEDPLIVLPSLAKRIGLEEAIVLQQIHYWVATQQKTQNERCFKHGFYWVYNTLEQWQETQFPWWSLMSVRRILKALEDMGLVTSRKLESQTDWNQRKWYTVNYAALRKLEQMSEGGCFFNRGERVKTIASLTRDEVVAMKGAIAESIEKSQLFNLTSSSCSKRTGEYIEQRLLTEKSCQSAEFLGNSAVEVEEEPLPENSPPEQENLKAIAQYMPLNKQLLSEIEKYTTEQAKDALAAFEKALNKHPDISNPVGYFIGILRNAATDVNRPKKRKPLTKRQLRNLVEQYQEYPIKVVVNGREILGELCNYFEDENAVCWQTDERSFFNTLDEIEIYHV